MIHHFCNILDYAHPTLATLQKIQCAQTTLKGIRMADQLLRAADRISTLKAADGDESIIANR